MCTHAVPSVDTHRHLVSHSYACRLHISSVSYATTHLHVLRRLLSNRRTYGSPHATDSRCGCCWLMDSPLHSTKPPWGPAHTDIECTRGMQGIERPSSVQNDHRRHPVQWELPAASSGRILSPLASSTTTHAALQHLPSLSLKPPSPPTHN